MAGHINPRRMTTGLLLVMSTIFMSATLASSLFSRTLSQHRDETRSSADFWSRVVSPETARAMKDDRQLQRSFLEAVELTADLTKRLAETFERVPELQQASDNIETYRKRLAADIKPQRRADPLSALGSLFGGGGGSAGGDSANASSGGLLSGLTSGISSALSGVGNSLLQDVGGAAMFLGTGLGAGAAQGLNLAPPEMTTQIAAKVAADNGMNASGINPAIQNAAMGATASLLGAVNLSSLSSSATGSIDIRGLALGLAQGIGNGTSAGLKLSPQAATMQAPAGNSTADIAGTFGFGLTKSLASNIDLSKATTGVNISSLTSGLSGLTGGQPVSQIALSLAQGIGDGTSSGLKLTQASLAPPQGSSVADALGAFGFGLTNSITSNINTSSLTSGLSGSLGSTNISQVLGNINLAQTASSFGTGLGSGAAAGLKLASAVVGAPDPNGNDIPNVAGNFAFGLTKSVTQNLNISQLASSFGGSSALSGATSSIDFGRVAQGAAMGLVQGAGDAVNSMGGLQALINGTAKLSTTPLPSGNMVFNDSVGGAATGLGQGLGGQGTLVGVQLLSQLNVTSLLDGLVNGNGTSIGSGIPLASPAAAAPAAPSNGTAKLKRDPFLPMEIVRRQAQTEVGAVGTNNSFNLSLIFNANTISSVGQRVIDALSCEGIGGLVLVGVGLVESGTIKTNSTTKFNTTLIKQALPKGVIQFTSRGNKYQIDGTILADNIDNNLLGAANGILVNGNPVIRFAVFLALHVIIALMAFVVLVPLVISLDAVRNLLVRLQMAHILPKIPRWMDMIWLYAMTPLALVALIFGSLAGGTAGHFRTVHGVLGLLTVLTTIGASGAHFYAKMKAPAELNDAVVFPHKPFRLLHPMTIRTAVNQGLLMLVLPTVIAGFADLSSVTICITRVIPFEAAIGFAVGLTFLYTVSSAISSLTLWLSMREVRAARKEASGDEESWGSKSLKEKIMVVKKESAPPRGRKQMDMTALEAP